ncbi:hypothetical protein ACWGID_29325 [Kribbella sp. NPDC054772]
MTDVRDELTEATRLYRQTESAHEAARQAVIAASLAALRAGLTPQEVEQHSPFTTTYVRKLARDAGIPPATRGPRPRAPRRTDAAAAPEGR